MYKLLPKDSLTGEISNTVKYFSTNVFIPFDIGNSDYQQFKKDLAEGASLKDAEGNDMTAEQITAFLGELK
jgi:hypothetical protein